MNISPKMWATIAVLLLIAIFGVSKVVMLQKAHSTFENYYAFRGCTTLIDRTDTYGHCKLPSGEVIKLVLYQGRWFLDGDLPTCWPGLCF